MFPKDKTVSKQWLIAIRRDNYTPSKHSCVCKKHFNPDDYALPKEPNTENQRALQRQMKRETVKVCVRYRKINVKNILLEETCEKIDIENSNKDVSL
ncbi:unnamed protein product [Parnassius apollo]|uniref:(apollo) hypothetical protein n=1 Tax=Parnassius apollo TaxID=110799 RepID=A0A8S3XGH7_PARAO|nr:unnamed protein product [Parnassius apollo]